MEVPSSSRVQSLVESGIAEVPPQYIQPSDIRPHKQDCSAAAAAAAASENGVPVIDLSSSSGSVSLEVGRACREWGAFHVTNHGVPLRLLEDMRTSGRSFFQDFPMSDKLKYSNSSSPASEGYGSRMLLEVSSSSSSESNAKNNNNNNNNSTTVLDWRDYFDHHTLPLSRRNPSRWPHAPPPNYRDIVAEYSDHMMSLTQKLLGLISESLDLPSSCIKDAVGEFYQNITVSYYPPCPQPDLTLGLQSHSDFGALTLLIQDDVGGLQVFKDGQWVNVPPVSDAILVILADQTEIITNGEYKSAQHRAVTNVNKARLSVATFHDPAKTTMISPAFQLMSESCPLRYRQVVYGEYVSSWYTKGPDGKRNIDALLL